MKKLTAILAFFLIFGLGALGAYEVETEDDEYVSDWVYISPQMSWEPIEAQTINLGEGKTVFREGDAGATFQIHASVMPLNTTDKTITYTSSNKSIAEVDENGIITSSGAQGSAVIDIRCGRALAKFKVQVIKPVTGVALSQSSMTLYADKPVTAKLEAAVSPADATIQDVIWKSGNDSIVFVDKDGLVRPCGVGETEVYAETADGGFIAKCTVTVTTWEKRKTDSPVEYVKYNITLDEMADIQMNAQPTVFTDAVYSAQRAEIMDFADPEKIASGYEKYQFMNLGVSNNVDAKTLDAYLEGKGVLSGHGSDFKAAAEKYNLSEVYLVIHACLESGNGTSRLASGTEYNGETVYNLFGIGAVDASPIEGGTEYAYREGWVSVEDAIYGGAQWISENYINNKKYSQNTLYKMRWNPEKPGVHQYATDIMWASKQAQSMGSMFEAFPSANYSFEVTVYNGQKEFKLQ